MAGFQRTLSNALALDASLDATGYGGPPRNRRGAERADTLCDQLERLLGTQLAWRYLEARWREYRHQCRPVRLARVAIVVLVVAIALASVGFGSLAGVVVLTVVGCVAAGYAWSFDRKDLEALVSWYHRIDRSCSGKAGLGEGDPLLVELIIKHGGWIPARSLVGRPDLAELVEQWLAAHCDGLSLKVVVGLAPDWDGTLAELTGVAALVGSRRQEF